MTGRGGLALGMEKSRQIAVALGKLDTTLEGGLEVGQLLRAMSRTMP